MLDGTGKQLLELLNRLNDTPGLTYSQLVTEANAEVDKAKAALDSLLALEGICDATTLKTPTGRKRRRDRGKKRAGNNGGEAAQPEAAGIVEAAGEVT